MKLRATKFEGIFRLGRQLLTRNLVPGRSVYGEKLIKVGKEEYREWIPSRSKPAAAICKGLQHFPLKAGMKVLYLGLAASTTASHFSDIVGKKGMIYGVEISERPLRDSLRIALERLNLAPILADAKRPEEYEALVEGVEFLYSDTADRDQVPILIRNAEYFLKSKGWAVIAIKSQSIDVTKPPKEVYKRCLQEFEEYFEVVDKVELDPFQKAHLFVVMHY